MSRKDPIIGFDEGWSKIHEKGIVKLQNILRNDLHGTSFNNEEFVDLYTTVYKMCIQRAPNRYTSELYDLFGKVLEEYLTSFALPAITAAGMGEFMLSALVKQWENHKIMQRWMVNFFAYLNRFYVVRFQKTPLGDVCVTNFRTLVFDKTKEATAKATLQLIENDREGLADVDRTLLRKIIQIFVEMGMGTTGVYNRDFEVRFLSDTKAFYIRKAAAWLESESCPQYLRKAEESIMSEHQRLRDFLHPSTEKKLTEVLVQTLLLQHQPDILGKKNTGCVVMLQTDSRNDLARMYNLYKEKPSSLEPIGRMVKSHIIGAGSELISEFNDESNSLKFITDLIELHDRYYSLVTDVFANNPIFDQALKDAFEEIVNKKMAMKQTTAELLSTYCDSLLKKNGLRMDETVLEDTLDKIVRIFSYLLDKDLFLQFYRKMLSKRLLMGRSASEDAEKSLIGKLKLRCGAQFTSKLEGMINDMQNAMEHQALFKQFCADRATMDMELDVQVLTTTYWPSYREDSIQLHKTMVDAIGLFEKYYESRTSNRRLKWIHSLGIVTLSANFQKKRVYLEVSTIQACILMVFNDFPSIKIIDLHRIIQVPLDELKRQLKPLVSKRYKVLNKTPPAQYDTSHVLSVNMGYNPARRKIRIPLVAAKTSDPERQRNILAVKEDRKHAIEACIVRIMKSRHTLEHVQLISEVSAQLMVHFKPDPREIKKRIEDLIGREYLERHPTKSNAYNYLA